MENFYLESKEELFSIIDRIKRSRDRRITLIVPAGLMALRSIINLKILKEEAISSGKDIAIITADSLIRKLASQVNLTVLDRIADSVEDKRQAEFEKKLSPRKKVISDIVIKHPVKQIKPILEEPTILEPKKIEEKVQPEDFGEEFRDLGEKEEQFEGLFRKKKEEQKKKEEEVLYRPEPKREKTNFRFFTAKKLIAFLIVLVLVGGGFILYFFLPKAQIIINPKEEDIRFEAEIVADKNIATVDLKNDKIPAQVFQIETENSRKFPTTGEKEVEEKAKGMITVYNQYSSGEQTLVKTTRFRSESGKIFRLIENVIIPGATIDEGKIIPSSKDVLVEADEAGETYNIGPSKFTIPGFEGSPKYTVFYGQSTEAMKGGAKGKMNVATKADIDGAIQIVSLDLKNKVNDEFNKKIPTDLKMLDNSQVLEVVSTDSTLEPDDPGKEFTITVKVKAWGLAFKESDVLSLIKELIKDKISQDKFLIVSTVKLDYAKAKVDSTKGTADFTTQVEAKTAWLIDEDKLKDDLAGKNEIDVRKYLSSLSEIETAKVIFWPFWVKSIPTNKNKIKIVIKTE